MMRRIPCAPILVPVLSVFFLLSCATPKDSDTAVRVRNNYELAYDGPVQFRTKLPDGTYEGRESKGEVRAGVARMVVTLPARSDVLLSRTGPLPESRSRSGPLTVSAGAHSFDLRWDGQPLGSLELGFVVVPGTSAQPSDVPSAFKPLDVTWKTQPDGAMEGETVQDGYRLQITLNPHGEGSLDVHTRLTHVEDAAGPAYVALVRRVTTVSPIDSARMRFNGRVLDGASSPDTWVRDFWYTRGVDWTSWKAGTLSMAAMSGFTPDPTMKRGSQWTEGSHYYVWERTRSDGHQLYLISEVEGPNAKQKGSVTPYAPIQKGDSLALSWHLRVTQNPAPGWAQSELRVFAGYQSVQPDSGVETVDLGVPAVSFGTSYFPYSTFVENFDYYRTPGLDRETWWPFSPTMWSNWRAFIPRMQTDLHIIRAMGFEWVRLHHLELLQEMDRKDALAFLDFYMGEARKLGLKVLVDTEGPADWVTLIMGRYHDVVRRVEIENEILIPPIKPDAPARWTKLYQAAKRADPQAQVFLTSAGSDGKFERLRALGVPFDRVDLHAYMHSPEWKETLSSHVLSTASYARSIGKFATLSEFNWKNLTRLSPEARRKEFVAVYEAMLAPRAMPEVFQFQFQETIGVNPSMSRSGVRHYETISLDRRPKPEAIELMRLIREYARPDAPVREVTIDIPEARLAGGSATVPFTITNNTRRALSVELTPMAFDGVEPRLRSAERVSLQPGAETSGTIELRLKPGAEVGTYHHFLEVAYDGKAAYGWGVAANPGAPTFSKTPVLGDRVLYPQGADVVGQLDWTRPLAVAYGPKAPVLEMEMAYLVANTLQSATGRPVRISSTADLPDSLKTRGTVILVGTRATNPLISTSPEYSATERGLVRLTTSDGGTHRLLLTGNSAKAVESAAIDFVLRYWLNAKDSGLRITGMEKGAALGDTARVTNPNPP